MAQPDLTFTIPSLQDRIELECRIYYPTKTPEIAEETHNHLVRGAVVAHPYASLGGNFDDPAVLTATQALLNRGYAVGTFNFRGAGASKGSTSWTGLPELADYVTFVGFFTSFLDNLGVGKHDLIGVSSEKKTEGEEAPSSSTTNDVKDQGKEDDQESRRPRISLVLGGYSYGSRILMHLPSVSSIVRRFTEGTPGSVEAIVVETAACIAAKELAGNEDKGLSPQRSHHSIHLGGSADPATSEARTRSGHRLSSPKKLSSSFRRSLDAMKGKRKPDVRSEQDDADVHDSGSREADGDASPSPYQLSNTKTLNESVDLRYLLISPVLPPAGWVTSPRLVRPSPRPIGTTPASMQVAGYRMNVVDEWWSYPSLVIYGDEDQFTSLKRLRHWLDDLGSGGGLISKAQRFEITHQDHFWYAPRSEERLIRAISDWLFENSAGDIA